MIIKLKRPSSHNSPAEESANTRRTVEGILDDIKKGGEAAVRAWSQELDHWNPASFQLSEQEIEHCRSEEHTSELQSRQYLVCRLLLEKKKNNNYSTWLHLMLSTSTGA